MSVDLQTSRSVQSESHCGRLNVFKRRLLHKKRSFILFYLKVLAQLAFANNSNQIVFTHFTQKRFSCMFSVCRRRHLNTLLNVTPSQFIHSFNSFIFFKHFLLLLLLLHSRLITKKAGKHNKSISGITNNKRQ